jgi:hypothetical protein
MVIDKSSSSGSDLDTREATVSESNENIVSSENTNISIKESNNEIKNVKFVNNAKSKIYLSYSYFFDGSWITIGWCGIESQSSFEISLPQNFDDDKIYWFAYSSGDNLEWQGSDRYFLVDQFSDTDFKIVDGIVEKNGGGEKVRKGFYVEQLESNTTEIRIYD